MMELYKKHRPANLDAVRGQAAAVKIIRGFGKNVPHACILTGPSGTGKTTLARIMAGIVGCDTGQAFDYNEVNCGVVESPLETARAIAAQMQGAALMGRARVWVLDEVQAFSRATFAQQALLKMLEDTPRHVYFFLCTTDPKKVIAAVRNRCTEIPTAPLKAPELAALVADVAKAESIKLPKDVAEKIVERADGSGRAALVLLEKVAGIADPEEQLAAVAPTGAEKVAFDLVKELLPFNKSRPVWNNVAAVLKAIDGEEPEGIRLMLLASARTALLKGNAAAADLIYKLREPYYDAGGKALLAEACFSFCNDANGKK